MWRCTCCGEIYDDNAQCPAWTECIREQRDDLYDTVADLKARDYARVSRVIRKGLARLRRLW